MSFSISIDGTKLTIHYRARGNYQHFDEVRKEIIRRENTVVINEVVVELDGIYYLIPKGINKIHDGINENDILLDKTILDPLHIEKEKELLKEKARIAFESSDVVRKLKEKETKKIANIKQKEQERIQNEEPIWFYSVDAETREGPVSFNEIKTLHDNKRIDDDTLVWSPNSEEWQAASIVVNIKQNIDVRDSHYEHETHKIKLPPSSEKITEKIADNCNNIASNTYEALIGDKNKTYYLTKFEKFNEANASLNASWNWPAFLTGGAWALYRKMYGWFFLLFSITLISNILEKEAPVVGAIIFLVSWIAFAVYSNSIYYNNLTKKITVAKKSITDETKLIEYLNLKGGVNTWVIWAFGVIPIIGILAAILIPSFADK